MNIYCPGLKSLWLDLFLKGLVFNRLESFFLVLFVMHELKY